MTGREWKPGDVVMGFDGMRGFVTAKGPGCGVHMHIAASGPHVHYASGDWDLCNVDGLRPLVVIDPEDRKQVERLESLMHSFDDPAEALREFASPTPPKPDEPTAMWSVVVDRVGDQWVRVLGPDFTDAWVRAVDVLRNGRWTAYHQIDAVEVLSPGVEAGEPS